MNNINDVDTLQDNLNIVVYVLKSVLMDIKNFLNSIFYSFTGSMNPILLFH